MNRFYKVIWSASRQVWGELAKLHGKRKSAVSTSCNSAFRRIITDSLLLILTTLWVHRLPSNGEIRAGQGTISQGNGTDECFCIGDDRVVTSRAATLHNSDKSKIIPEIFYLSIDNISRGQNVIYPPG